MARFSTFVVMAWMAIGWAYALGGLPVQAQEKPRDTEMTSAKLPRDNETAIRIRQLEQALQDGDYRLAVRLAEQLYDVPISLVSVEGQSTLYPISQQVSQMLSRFPAEGVEMYRDLHDSKVAISFESAVADGDVAALKDLFRRHQLSSHWERIGETLAAFQVDHGEYYEALDTVDRLLSVGVKQVDETRLRAMRVGILAKLGATHAAQREMDSLAMQFQTEADELLSSRLSQWLDKQRHSVVEEWARLSPLMTPKIEWRRNLSVHGDSEHVESGAVLVSRLLDTMGFPLQNMIISNGVLFVRQRGKIWAFDESTLKPMPNWPVHELPFDLIAVTDQMRTRGARDESVEASEVLDWLLTVAWRTAMSADGSRLYTIEAPAIVGSLTRKTRPAQREWKNELVARDIRTGEIRWRSGQASTGWGREVGFLDVPVSFQGKLLVLFKQESDLFLGIAEPETGQLVDRYIIVESPTNFTIGGGQSYLLIDANTLFVITGNGVIGTIDGSVATVWRDGATAEVDTLSEKVSPPWRWAYTYSSSVLGARRPWDYGSQQEFSSYIERPVLNETTLIVAPRDSENVFAFDRASGRALWSTPLDRKGMRWIGVCDQGLLCVGDSLKCLSIADPGQILWNTPPLGITGRPKVTRGCAYVPTDEGIVVVDLQTGKIVAEQYDPQSPQDWAIAANLFSAPAALYALTPSSIIKYPHVDAKGDLANQHANGVENTYRRAMVRFMQGDAQGAYNIIEDNTCDDREMNAIMRELEVELLLALVENEADRPKALAYLQRARDLLLQLSHAEEATVRLAKMLEAFDLTQDAIDLHKKLLLCENVTAVIESGEGYRLEQAQWMWASQRLSKLLDGMPENTQQQFWSDLVTQTLATSSFDVWIRVFTLLPTPEAQSRLAKAIVLHEFDDSATPSDHGRSEKLPIERLSELLPYADKTQKSTQEAVRLAMLGWEVSIAKGDIEASEQAQQVFLAAAERAESESVDIVRSIKRRLRRKMRKLAMTSTSRLDANLEFLWRKELSSIVVSDQSIPMSPDAPIILRNHGERQLAVVRQADGLSSMQSDIPDAALIRSVSKRDENWQGDFRLNSPDARGGSWVGWSCKQSGDIAVVPTVRGLIALDMTPGTARSRVIWTYEIPEWSVLGSWLSNSIVVGENGVFVRHGANEIICVGLGDGKPRWRLSLPDMSLRTIMYAGKHIVVVDKENAIYVIDAMTGGKLQKIGDDNETTVACCVVADVICRWTETTLYGISGDTLDVLWQCDCPKVNESFPVLGKDWIVHTDANVDGRWLRDVHTGQTVFDKPLLGLGFVVGLAADDKCLYASSRGFGEKARDFARNLSAFNLSDGQKKWSTPIKGAMYVESRHMLGNPDYIPVMDWPVDEYGGHSTLDKMTLQLIDKQTGQAVELRQEAESSPTKLSIAPYLEEPNATKAPRLEITPTNLLLQVGGQTLAFGRSWIEVSH